MSIGSVSPRDHQLAAQARLVNQYLSGAGTAGNALSGVPGAAVDSEQQADRSLQSLDVASQQSQNTPAADAARLAQSPASKDVREKFDAFVGQSFYGQLLHEMHKTVGKAHYFNGGRAEEAFQGQLDQVLSENMAKANAGQFTGPMFELFNAQMQAANRR